MMKVKIDIETMNRVLQIVRPLSGSECYMSIDFGTGKVPGVNGVADAMRSKVSVSTGNEQIEAGILTAIPEELERPLEECSLVNPLEKAVFEVAEFVSVADALSQYEQAFILTTDENKVIFSVEGLAQMPVYKADVALMKALIPHRQNSEAFHLFDPDIMTIRVIGRELLEATKAATALAKKVESEALKYYAVSVMDAPLVKQEIEKDGKTCAVTKYNSRMQIAGTDRCAFSSGVVDTFIHKGAGNDLLGVIKDKDSLKNVNSPVISFVKEGEVIKPSIKAYAEFKKEYDESRDLKCDEKEFRFGIPMDAMDKIIRLVSIAPDFYVDITVGAKYLYIMLTGLGCIYMCAQKTIKGDGFLGAMRGLAESIKRKECAIAVDMKNLQSSFKLTQLYEKDALYSRMPIEILVEEKGITMKKGEAVSLVEAVSADTKIDTVTYGINGSYIPCVTSGLPSGTIQFNYGMEKPIMVFTKGGEVPSMDGTWIMVSGIEDIETSKRQIEEAYRKAEEDKQKKAEEKKK